MMNFKQKLIHDKKELQRENEGLKIGIEKKRTQIQNLKDEINTSQEITERNEQFIEFYTEKIKELKNP